MNELSRKSRKIPLVLALALIAGGPALSEEDRGRYIWINVPYSMTSPGMTIGGGSSCYGGSSSSAYGSSSAYAQPYSNGLSINGSGYATGSSSGYNECSQDPTIHIPTSTSNKALSVHIVCKDRTYDAKGDGMGWKSWGEEAAVYERAIKAWRGESSEQRGKLLSKMREQAKAEYEERRIIEKDVIKQNNYNVDMRINISLANMNSLQPFFETKPDMIGLSNKAEVTRYIFYRNRLLGRKLRKISLAGKSRSKSAKSTTFLSKSQKPAGRASSLSLFTHIFSDIKIVLTTYFIGS